MGELYQAGEVGTFFKNKNTTKYYKIDAMKGHVDTQYKLLGIYLLKWNHDSTSHFDKGLFWILYASLHKRKISRNQHKSQKSY